MIVQTNRKLGDINSGHIADNDLYPETKKRKGENWKASVSYSGGTDANRSVFSERPGSIISGEETEKVETKTHHYIPFVVSLSLQKNPSGIILA